MNPMLKYILVCILIFCCVQVSADVQYKVWDKNARVIHFALELIPPELVPSDNIFIETIDKKEATRMFKTIAPKEKHVGGILGLYIERQNNFAPQIFLMDWRTKNKLETLKVILHEYGHLVYGEMLTDAQRDKWNNLWNDELTNNTLPSKYATTNQEEGFAEVFLYYTLNHSNQEETSFIDSIIESRSQVLRAINCRSLSFNPR